MKTTRMALALFMTIVVPVAIAQGKLPAAQSGAEFQDDHEPPPKAYADCRGKEVGEVVQHASSNGLVAATCVESPQGPVARPVKRFSATEGTHPAPDSFPVTKTTGNIVLTSSAADQTGTLSAEYTCDGNGSSPALSWANVPPGTREFAVMMTTLPPDGRPQWNWVVYGIPATTTELTKNAVGIGTQGMGSHGSTAGYEPPCSKGPGPKTYTFTVYALSAHPELDAGLVVSGDVLTHAIAGITLDSGTLNVHYDRPRKPPADGFGDLKPPSSAF
ncbi:MAG: YbhB/YbcL family Raf kinase inhibitor-like protein [Polaromonas sp.]